MLFFLNLLLLRFYVCVLVILKNGLVVSAAKSRTSGSSHHTRSAVLCFARLWSNSVSLSRQFLEDRTDSTIRPTSSPFSEADSNCSKRTCDYQSTTSYVCCSCYAGKYHLTDTDDSESILQLLGTPRYELATLNREECFLAVCMNTGLAICVLHFFRTLETYFCCAVAKDFRRKRLLLLDSIESDSIFSVELAKGKTNKISSSSLRVEFWWFSFSTISFQSCNALWNWKSK